MVLNVVKGYGVIRGDEVFLVEVCKIISFVVYYYEYFFGMFV